MWIFTKKGFFSIVQDKGDEDYLIVRARVKGDLEKYFYEPSVQEDAGSDYRYRVRVTRERVGILLSEALAEIDYTNYKAAVTMEDPRRSEYYGMVWAIMSDMQFSFLEEE